METDGWIKSSYSSESANCVQVFDWRKSTHSTDTGACVEIAWTKSSASNPNGNCVQVALDGSEVQVRDSKHPEGPVLRFAGSGWDAFLAGVKNNEFDV